MKLLYLFIILILGAVLFWIYRSDVFNPTSHKTADVLIGNARFSVDVADGPLEREKGLGGRESLGPDGGMLFVWGAVGHRTIIMRDMVLPIDIVWITNGKVLGFEEDVQPEPGVPLHKLVRYRSPEPVEMVLEMAAGAVRREGIAVSESVNVKFE